MKRLRWLARFRKAFASIWRIAPVVPPLALLLVVPGCHRLKAVLERREAAARRAEASSAPAPPPRIAAIGMNLTGLSPSAAEAPFVDRMHVTSQWIAPRLGGSDFLPDGTIALDRAGVPKAVPRGASGVWIIVGLDPTTAATTDRYVLMYKGKAHIGFDAARLIESGPGRIRFEFLKPIDAALMLQVSDIDPKDPLRDIHIVREDQLALFRAGETFNPAFLAKVRNWDTVRLMDWLGTNSAGPVSWGTRETPRTSAWSLRGVPLEIAVQLANRAHVNLWLNVPTRADDAYVGNMAALVKASLDPKLKAYFEYSNEMWNWSGANSHFAQDAGNRLWGTDANHDGRIDKDDRAENYGPGWLTFYGYRAAQVAAIVNRVYAGADRARYATVLATMTGVAVEDSVFDGITRAHVGGIGALFDVFAVTTYFGSSLASAATGADHARLLAWARSGKAGVDAAFEELTKGGQLGGSDPVAARRPIYASYRKILADNHLELVAYEGGAHLTVAALPPEGRGEIIDFFTRLDRDPRMGRLYAEMVAEFGRNGGTLLNVFNDVGPPSGYGYWGVLDTIYQASSPRYDALKAAQARAVAAAGHTGR